MLLSARPLADASSVNSFRYADTLGANQGDAGYLYFQLVDLEQNLSSHGFSPPGQRYVPAAGATLAVQFLNIDAARQFTRFAATPFAEDRSIWRVAILASDPLDATQSLKMVLTEGSVIRSFRLQGVLRVNGTGLCGC
jgi:hypothetical protein